MDRLLGLLLLFGLACTEDSRTPGSNDPGTTPEDTALPPADDSGTSGGDDSGDTGDTSTDTGTPPPPEPAVPELGFDPIATTFGTDLDGLDVVRDLGFNPAAPEQLWTVNRATDGTVIYFHPGTPEQTSEERIDAYASHFMEEVSSIAFTDANTFATCQESRNTYNGTAAPNDFMGPALWPADLDIYAMVHQDDGLLGSHLDMNHSSPLCMGIAWDHDNVFWVFDGLNGHVVRYDFQDDHGPGHDDHSDGIIRRYTEAELERVAGVPGHLELDRATGWLYVADTGTGRVLRLDTASGHFEQTLEETNEYLEEYSEWGGVTVETFAEGFGEPSGIAIAETRLFVGDHASGEIVVFDLTTGVELDRFQTEAEGLMGLEISPDGRLWYVDAVANTLVRIDPA